MSKKKALSSEKQITLTLNNSQYKELLNYAILGEFICNGLKTPTKKKLAETDAFFHHLLSIGYAAKSDAVIAQKGEDGYACSSAVDKQMSKSLTQYNDVIAELAIQDMVSNLVASTDGKKKVKK